MSSAYTSTTATNETFRAGAGRLGILREFINERSCRHTRHRPVSRTLPVFEGLLFGQRDDDGGCNKTSVQPLFRPRCIYAWSRPEIMDACVRACVCVCLFSLKIVFVSSYISSSSLLYLIKQY